MSARTIWAIARADFRERRRRYSFLMALAGTLYFGYLVNAGHLSLRVDGYRGVFNSAWVGTLIGLIIGTLLPLLGFYLVKSSVAGDRRSRVGEVLAATPLAKADYTLGKALANFLLLAVMVAILGAAALCYQLLAGEERRVEAGALLGALVWLALPPVALGAAAAVLFECVRWLRGSFGNVAYFFLWCALLTLPLSVPRFNADLMGMGLVETSFRQTLGAAGLATVRPSSPGGHGLTLQIGPREPPQRLRVGPRWSGIDWTSAAVAGRLAWFGAAFALALAAALPFRRFDPAWEGPPGDNGRERRGKRATQREARAGRRARGALTWQPRSRLLALVLAELRLMVKGRSRWWLAGAAGLWIGGLVAEPGVARGILLAIAWLWPLPLWSAMGAREAQHGTGQLVFSAPLARSLHAATIWAAGVLVAAAAGSGVGLRLLFEHDAPALLGWLAGCLFIPSLALALGAASGTSRLFEIVYLLLWYVGPMNQVAALDYTGMAAAAQRAGYSWIYLGLSPLLLALACLARHRRARI